MSFICAVKRSIMVGGIFFGVLAAGQAGALTLKETITGDLSSKSVVHSGSGLFFAQNMMYRHTISVFDRSFGLVKTISDRVSLSAFGHKDYQGDYRGSPVEAAFSHGGKYAWVSNYQMYGKGFQNPGNDDCTPEGKHDHSYVYRINTEDLKIEQVIQVGAVPKYVAVSPDDRLVLVSNWCSWDVSVIDSASNKTVKSVFVGRYPRGLVVSPDSSKAYIAVMGSYDIAIMDLRTYALSWIKGVGRSPRHLQLSPDGRYLYATLNGEDHVAKVDLESGAVVKKVSTGERPRSMVLSDDGGSLYVVNYKSDSVSKLRTDTMEIVKTVKVDHHPIGITFDPEKRQVWVACYSGTILVFQD
jgi:YVTN family beta-propeller protein